MQRIIWHRIGIYGDIQGNWELAGIYKLKNLGVVAVLGFRRFAALSPKPSTPLNPKPGLRILRLQT